MAEDIDKTLVIWWDSFDNDISMSISGSYDGPYSYTGSFKDYFGNSIVMSNGNEVGTPWSTVSAGYTVQFVPPTGYSISYYVVPVNTSNGIEFTQYAKTYTTSSPVKIDYRVESEGFRYGVRIRNIVKTANKYTVTFDRQSGSGGDSSASVAYGSAMPTIKVPSRTGYTFGGYYTSANGGGTKYYNADGTSARKWDKTANTTLYAYWTANEYTVTFDRQSGSGGDSSASVTHGSAMPTIKVPSRTGYTFGGYYTSANGGGTKYYNADGTSARKWDKTANTTLYAYWIASRYDVTLNTSVQGHLCDITSGGSVYSVTYGSSYSFLNNVVVTPKNSTKGFGGWYKESTFDTQITADSICQTPSNHTLYAKTVEGKFTVSFNNNGGIGSTPASQTVPIGTSITMPKTEARKYNSEHNYDYVFLGWSKDPSATTAAYIVDQEVVFGSVNDGDEITLYAVWQRQFKVVWGIETNDSDYSGTIDSGGFVSGAYYKAGEKITLRATPNDSTTTRFVKWFESVDLGDGKHEEKDYGKTEEIEITVPTNDLFLTALFIRITVDVRTTFNSWNGKDFYSVNIKKDGVLLDSVVESSGEQWFKDVPEGSVVEYVFNLNYDSQVDSFSVNSEAYEVNGSAYTVSIDEELVASGKVTISGATKEKPYTTLTVKKSGRGENGGQVEISDAYGNSWSISTGGGESAQLKAYLGNTYTFEAFSQLFYVAFSKWLRGEGVTLSPDANYSYTIKKTDVEDENPSMTITANFYSQLHSLKVTADDERKVFLATKVNGSDWSENIGSVYDEQTVEVTATPSVIYNLTGWSVTGDSTIQYGNPLSLKIGNSLPVDIEIKAVLQEKNHMTHKMTKENGDYGSVSLSYVDDITSGGALGKTEYIIEEDSNGVIQREIYSGVIYTAKAELHESLSNAGRALTYFDGWSTKEDNKSNFKETTKDLITKFSDIVESKAVFRAYTLYDVALVQSTGGTCSFNLEKNTYDAADANGIYQWIEGEEVFVSASAADGYEFKRWTVVKDGNPEPENGEHSQADYSFLVNGNIELIPVFERKKCAVTCYVDEASQKVDAGSITVDVADLDNLYYGDEVTFTAEPNVGYGFDGWYENGRRVSQNVTYTKELKGNLTLVAKFTATLTISKIPNDDNSGSVFIKFPDDDDYQNAVGSWTVPLGTVYSIKAEGSETEGIYFSAWYDASDTNFKAPLPIGEEDNLTFENHTSYVARFVDTKNFFYAAFFNSSVEGEENDVSSCKIDISNGIAISETDFNTGLTANGYSGDGITGAYSYLSFAGTKNVTVTPQSNTLKFQGWKIETLKDGDFEEGVSASEITVINSNAIYTAQWRKFQKKPITISIEKASIGRGTISMDNATDDRVQGETVISDSILEDIDITVSASPNSGYSFVGWYSDDAFVSELNDFTFPSGMYKSLTARFEEDRNAIYKWEGSDILKTIRWKSKVYVSNKPFDPTTARVDALSDSVQMTISMFSSPNDADNPSTQKEVTMVGQDARRLPKARPERFCQIELVGSNEINAVFLGTSMEGLKA